MKKKTFLLIAAVAVVYVLLLLLLTYFEGMQDGATIQSFGDALWYSLVTMTTVGYGDLYPASLGGRIIGFVFLLLSIGVLTAVLYSLISLIRTKFMPFIRMQLVHGKTCFIFSELNEASVALARDLIKKDPERSIFFCDVTDQDLKKIYLPYKHLMFRSQNVNDTVRSAAGKKNRYAANIQVFLISEDILANYVAAKELEDVPVKIYCRGMETSRLPVASFFDAYDCCARQYWKTWPVCSRERRIIIAGDGHLAWALLDRAITINCRIPFASSCYHLFGDWTQYQSLHPALSQVFFIGKEAVGRDSLIFHPGKWYENETLLKKADRIIFCSDDQKENVVASAMASRYFALSLQIHTAALNSASGEGTFGDPASLYTEELVIKSALDQQARSMHEAYCESVGDQDNPWESLSPFLKDSNRSAADHLITKIRILLPEKEPTEADEISCMEAYERWKTAEDKEPYRRNEHERWLRFHSLYNWRWGPEKDRKARTHPCIVDYIDLPEKEKEKDDNAWEQIGQRVSAQERGK